MKSQNKSSTAVFTAMQVIMWLSSGALIITGNFIGGFLIYLLCEGLGPKRPVFNFFKKILSDPLLPDTSTAEKKEVTTKIIENTVIAVIPPPPVIKVTEGKIGNPIFKSKIFISGFAIAIILISFPPWNLWINTASVRLNKNYGRCFIFTPPKTEPSWSASIDYGRLGLELLVTSMATGVVLVIRHRQNGGQP